jgi:hypothetical protein
MTFFAVKIMDKLGNWANNASSTQFSSCVQFHQHFKSMLPPNYKCKKTVCLFSNEKAAYKMLAKLTPEGIYVHMDIKIHKLLKNIPCVGFELLAAKCKAVFPPLSLTRTFAFRFNRVRTIVTSPF